MTNKRSNDRDSEPSAQNDEQKQMRGFFAVLRMTNKRQKHIPFGNDKQIGKYRGPSLRSG
jgi:hypothetical protein